MPEYHILRIACMLAEIAVLRAYLRSIEPVIVDFKGRTAERPGPIRKRVFATMMLSSALYHAIPAQVFDAQWLRAVQAPLLAVILAASILISLELFAWYPMRQHLLAAAMAAGCIPALAGWLWIPQNLYQATMVSRQQIVLGLAAGVGVAWAWVTRLEPVPVPKGAPLGLWALWLAAGIPDAISTKGGLLWAVFPWHDGLTYWRVANDLTLAARLVVLVAWAVSLRRPRAVSPGLPIGSRATSAS